MLNHPQRRSFENDTTQLYYLSSILYSSRNRNALDLFNYLGQRRQRIWGTESARKKSCVTEDSVPMKNQELGETYQENFLIFPICNPHPVTRWLILPSLLLTFLQVPIKGFDLAFAWQYLSPDGDCPQERWARTTENTHTCPVCCTSTKKRAQVQTGPFSSTPHHHNGCDLGIRNS